MTDKQSDAVAVATPVTPEEIEAIRAENAALKAQLAEQSQAQGKGGGWRSVVAWILVVLRFSAWCLRCSPSG